MKHAIRVAAFAAAALSTSVLISQVEQKTQRFPQFENPDVKVWKTIVMPNQPLIKPHVWETGKAYWLPAMPPNTLHSDINAGEKPMEVMVVELEKEN